MTRVTFEGDKCCAIIDNVGAYGEYAKTALRGMLVTNGRKTTVVQDEIEFSAPCEAFAAYHYNSKEISVEISEDRRECIMTHSDGTKLSLKLISDNSGAGFEITGCYDFVLPNTKSFEGEFSREDYSRLLVRYGKTEKIRSAFVIELLSDSASGYSEIIPVNEW
jgi:hypothetical protein